MNSTYVFFTGGCCFERREVLSSHLSLNAKTGYVFKHKDIPAPKFAHGAAICADKIVITSGINDMMLNMNMRAVPEG